MADLLWATVIDYASGNGTDLTTLGPIGTPNTVVVENTEIHDASVFFQLHTTGFGGADLPVSAGTAEDCWRLSPGQRSPQIAIPSGYTLWAYVLNPGDLATIQIQQANA